MAKETNGLAKEDPKKGYNELLLYRMEQVLPLAIKHKVKVITNMGAANPLSAMEDIAKLAHKMNLKNLTWQMRQQNYPLSMKKKKSHFLLEKRKLQVMQGLIFHQH